MNVWVCKSIDILKYKDTIIDSLVALKAALGEEFNERTIWISDLWGESMSDFGFVPRNHVLYVPGGTSYRIPCTVYKAYIDLRRCGMPGDKLEESAWIDELRPEEDARSTIRIRCLESSLPEIPFCSNLFCVDIDNRTIHSDENYSSVRRECEYLGDNINIWEII